MIDPTLYRWCDDSWRGIPKDKLVIYECHIGTLTPAGTFQAAQERIPEWKSLGVTAIELLPVAQTPGRWNWGYDGVHPFAVRNSYGSPDDFKAFVDACHLAGLAVILDVVYNHLGPEGNYLADFGPYFSSRHVTPWGSAFNFDGPECGPVRSYILANARQWLVEFHVDGLRLDAAHFMFDDSETHILRTLRQAVDNWQLQLGRPLYLIAETNVFDPHAVASTENTLGLGMDAVWCDDLMHALLSIPQGAPQLTHRTYRGHDDVATFLRRGHVFGFDQQASERYVRIAPDQPSRVARLDTLVVGIQTHDSVGNHPLGRRMHALGSMEFQRAAAACMLLYPSIPILFMGEEFCSPSPFLFFVDFHDSRLRKSIEKYRRLEYPDHDWSQSLSPVDDRAFWASQRGDRDQGDQVTWHWYQSLLQVRRAWQAEGLLCGGRKPNVHYDPAHGLFVLQYCSEGTAIGYVAVRIGGASTREEIILNLAESPLLDSHATPFESVSCPPGTQVIRRIAENQAIVGRGAIAWTSPDR